MFRRLLGGYIPSFGWHRVELDGHYDSVEVQVTQNDRVNLTLVRFHLGRDRFTWDRYDLTSDRSEFSRPWGCTLYLEIQT